jgi:prevent-host-death family protein
MDSVTIAELKANLSKYLRRVRAGEQILVCDRSVPVGKLVPLTPGEDVEARELELAAAGVLRLPDGPASGQEPGGRGGRIRAADVLAALDADRDE